MKPNYTIVGACVACAFVALPLQAQTQRDLGSHQHGLASLNVVVDGSTIFIEFESPWANLTGFEHSPSTEEQHALLNDALVQLGNADSLFSFPDSEGCTSQTINVVDTLSSGDSHEEHHDDDHEESHDEEHHEDAHDEDSHDEDSHDEHHEDSHDEDSHDEHHEDAHDEASHEEHDEDSHSDLLVEFAFECADIDSVDQLTVNLFTYWPGIETLTGQLATGTFQSSFDLTAGSNTIDLKTSN